MSKSEKILPGRRKKHASKLAFSVSFNRHSLCLKIYKSPVHAPFSGDESVRVSQVIKLAQYSFLTYK